MLLDRGQTGNYLNLPYFGGDNGTRCALDDEGINRINSNNIITNWIEQNSGTIASTDSSVRFALSDIGYRWVRIFWDSTSGTGDISSFRASFKGY